MTTRRSPSEEALAPRRRYTPTKRYTPDEALYPDEALAPRSAGSPEALAWRRASASSRGAAHGAPPAPLSSPSFLIKEPPFSNQIQSNLAKFSKFQQNLRFFAFFRAFSRLFAPFRKKMAPPRKMHPRGRLSPPARLFWGGVGKIFPPAREPAASRFSRVPS